MRAPILLSLLALVACDQSDDLRSANVRPEAVRLAAVEIFSEMCLDKLPAMEGTREAMKEIAEREFGRPPGLDQEIFGSAIQRTAGLQLTRGTSDWPDFAGENRCEVTAARVDPSLAAGEALTAFETRHPGLTLIDAAPDGPGEVRSWDISGAGPAMRLEIATGASAAGGNRATTLRLSWRDG